MITGIVIKTLTGPGTLSGRLFIFPEKWGKQNKE